MRDKPPALFTLHSLLFEFHPADKLGLTAGREFADAAAKKVTLFMRPGGNCILIKTFFSFYFVWDFMGELAYGEIKVKIGNLNLRYAKCVRPLLGKVEDPSVPVTF